MANEWRPKIGERYYIVLLDVSGWYYAHHRRFANDETCKCFLRTNNCFRTYELAETIGLAIDKLFKESEHG
jgi:hypothetical protein